ncbi:hypothetical protein [Modestobacter lapidis]|nr:hypothetical protein [Modestobacter lapidis]
MRPEIRDSLLTPLPFTRWSSASITNLLVLSHSSDLYARGEDDLAIHNDVIATVVRNLS